MQLLQIEHPQRKSLIPPLPKGILFDYDLVAAVVIST